jgi:hypothetical protein
MANAVKTGSGAWCKKDVIRPVFADIAFLTPNVIVIGM